MTYCFYAWPSHGMLYICINIIMFYMLCRLPVLPCHTYCWLVPGVTYCRKDAVHRRLLYLASEMLRVFLREGPVTVDALSAALLTDDVRLTREHYTEFWTI